MTLSNAFKFIAAIAMATTPARATGITPTVVDLSLDLAEDTAAQASSPGAQVILDFASADPLMRSAVVLEDGKVVSKYYRDDIDPTTPHQVWSTTKSWTSLLIGILVDKGMLSVEDTLGDILQDDTAWADVVDGTVDFRKDVTVEEMLTMTSGLITPPEDDPTKMDPSEMTLENLPPGAIEEELTTGGGISLSDSLAYPDIGTKGEFAYLGLSNILSYVIKEKSGMSPRQFLAENVMKKLGIAEDEYNWLTNPDGMEFAYHGLELTALQMAKFGQLYLQNGQASPTSLLSKERSGAGNDNQVISKSWVDASFKPYAKDDTIWKLNYGYLFWERSPTMYCALGAMGQDICIDRGSSRVIVQQRDVNPDNLMEGNFLVAPLASNATLSFAVASDVLKDPSPASQVNTVLPWFVLGLVALVI